MRTAILFAVALVALIAGVVRVGGRGTLAAVERSAPRRPSMHAIPPEDVIENNAVAERQLPESLRHSVLPDDRPGVVLFLKADCGCSEDFARLFTAVEPHLRRWAACLALIDTHTASSERFLETTGLTMPHLDQADGSLAAAWGVTKAGCVALVRPDGSVEAIWPGISRQGFRELASRLGDGGMLPPDAVAGFPGAATAGCPLHTNLSPSTPTGVSP
ncbi:MAG: hypothetical protein ACR2IT_03685 [Pirellulales bacterium]